MALLLIKRNENAGHDYEKKWRAGDLVDAWESGHQFPVGTPEHLDSGNFLHLTVTDRTMVEARAWLTRIHQREATVTQLSAQGNNRVIRVTAGMASTSGEAGFDDPNNPGNPKPAFDIMLAEINIDYPQSDATYVAHTHNTYDFSIKAPVQARDYIVEMCLQLLKGRYFKGRPRRYYMPQASMDTMIANGGTWSATAQQLIQGGHILDRLDA